METKKVSIFENEKISKVYMDNIYLALFGLLTFDRLLSTTMFVFAFPEKVRMLLHLSLFVYLAIKIWNGCRPGKGEVIFTLIFMGTSFLVWRNTGNVEILDVAFLIAGAYGIRFEKILKTYISIVIPFIVLTIAASQTGLVENLIYYRGDIKRIAFGFIYPTDFVAHIFYAGVVWCAFRNTALTYGEIAALILLAVFSYIFCDARMNELCLILTAAVFLVMKVWNEKTGRNQKKEKIEACLGRLLIWGNVFCGSVIILMTWIYDSANPVWRKLDSLMSQRLQFGKRGFDEFGIPLFGQGLPIVGMGREKVWPDNYFFLDSSYVKVLLEYGAVLFLIVVLMFTINAYRSYKEKRYYLLLALNLIALQCVIEHHMLEIAYNPFLFMLFADITDASMKNLESKSRAGYPFDK